MKFKFKTMRNNQMNEVELKYNSGIIISEKIKTIIEAEKIIRNCFDPETIDAYESFHCVFIDKDDTPRKYIKLSSGGVTAAIVDMRLLFSAMIKTKCKKLIVSHNHPSGTLKFSQADLNLTKKIKNCCDYLGFELIDHILITSDNYASMKSEHNNI
jgi:DNA repair protein RadC